MTARFDTEQQAWQAAAEVRGGAGTPIRTGYITSSLTADGLELGPYDGEIARWLARADAEIVAVVLSWVERAHAAGRAAAERRTAKADAR